MPDDVVPKVSVELTQDRLPVFEFDAGHFTLWHHVPRGLVS